MSPSLSDKLKSLGVKVGTVDITPPQKPRENGALADALGGVWRTTRRGEALVVMQDFPLTYQHGTMPLHTTAAFATMGAWASEPNLRGLNLNQFAFLDTETSGLSGGTGTYAFMIGVGRFMDDHYHLEQFFMPGPAEEPALLEALADFLAPCAALVTFNGKAFDAQLLRTRYTLHSIPNPFADFAHIDLLPLARRLWRDRLPSRALKYLEENLMLAPRNSEEVPGYEIPFLYFDYLRTGDPSPLHGVFYHNAMDIVAMTALFSQTSAMLQDPHTAPIAHGLDVIALGKLFEDLARYEDAARLYERGLAMSVGEEHFWQAARRLSALQKRRGDLTRAAALWEQSAAEGHIYAHIELAKYHEHHQKNYARALAHTHAALDLLNAPGTPAYQRAHWLEDAQKRLQRLERKVRASR